MRGKRERGSSLRIARALASFSHRREVREKTEIKRYMWAGRKTDAVKREEREREREREKWREFQEAGMRDGISPASLILSFRCRDSLGESVSRAATTVGPCVKGAGCEGNHAAELLYACLCGYRIVFGDEIVGVVVFFFWERMFMRVG